MFGLLTSQPCLMNSNQKILWRFHYCSTCKTLGKHFGQKSRFVLNSDVVFMSEILSALSDDLPKISNDLLNQNIGNCFSLQNNFDKLPQYIQYAASINILLCQMKFKDKIDDSYSIIARILNKIFTNKFKKAEKLLQELDYPISTFWNWLDIQKERESEKFGTIQDSLRDEILQYLSEPTAMMTGLTFKHGAQLIDRLDQNEQLFQFGYQLGRLAYVMDAFEDYENDFRKNNFNAIATTFNISETHLTQDILDSVIKTLIQIKNEMINIIKTWSLPDSQKHLFIKRIEMSLEERLNPSSRTMRIKNLLTNRWYHAKNKSRTILSENLSDLRESHLKVFLTYKYLLVLNFLFPQPGYSHNLINGQSDCSCQKISGCCFACLIISIINRAFQVCCCGERNE